MGLEQSEKLIKATNFPWLLTNMTLKDGTRPAGTQEYEIVEHEGWRIGVIGIAEYDWIATLTCLDFEDIDYYEFCETAETYGKMLSQLKLFGLYLERQKLIKKILLFFVF